MIVPFDLMGTKGTIDTNPYYSVLSLIGGDISSPLIEIVDNESWMGYPIRYETPWNEDAPEYKKANKKTKAVYVELSKAINSIDNPSSGILKGKYDSQFTNPSNMEYAIESYGGGAFKEIGNSMTIIKDYITKGEFDINEFPVIRGLYRESNDKTKYQRTNLKYSYYKDEAETYKNELNALKKSKEKEDVLLYAKYIGTEYSKPPKFKRMMLVERFKSSVEKPLRKIINEETDEEKIAAYELRLWQEKKALVEMLDELE